MAKTANEVINLARSWIGKNDRDGSHREIVDVYNSLPKEQRPRGLKMQYNWSWCACFWSALAIKLWYIDIMPIEISCGELIKKAKQMGIWVESDDIIPFPGYAVLYDWDDKGISDCTGWPDHIGLVESVNHSGGNFTTIEGNYKNSVKRRTVSFDARNIRGFIAPRYDLCDVSAPTISTIEKPVKAVAAEVIAGIWGNNPKRKESLIAAGYDYDKVQSEVNNILNGRATTGNDTNLEQPFNRFAVAKDKPRLTKQDLAGLWYNTADLYLRNGAGTNKRAICVIPKETVVNCSGKFSLSGSGLQWLYVNFIMDGTYYEGFASEKYLKRM